ncbi:hypothetical protein P170DRAFT_474345 [Aspergillus steynii IBT 23096]|uniref:Uncharacterized protein n=1 Tax=Aspergillus steynii IBT 23096 TaxID=1392250 RepID=A0A2I2GD44_9EURO|nr:uncharacterized protein P170DRAFT_474345 [Aspergillus steynii IBT 23096]PLB50790.1 hypothetical protein P170DRAFT_474345 [Aspergillus steynii IBT 23096]
MSRSSETSFSGPAAKYMRQSPRLNSRLPPLAHRSSSPLPCRMVVLSRDKLQHESSARSPDLRRCLAHDRVLRRSIQIAQEDMKKAMAALRVDDSDSEEEFDPGSETAPVTIIRDQIASVVKSFVRRRSPERSSSSPPAEKDRLKVELARVSSNSSAKSSSSSTSITSLSSRSRRYAARLGLGRRLCSPSAVQPMVS